MAQGLGTKTQEGSFLALVDEDQAIKESIYNILTTRKGERVGNAEFGCDLNSLLFNPNIEYYWEAIKLEIMSSVERWEPRVQLLNIEFAQVDNSLTLFVVFVKLETETIDSLSVVNL